MQFLGDCIHSMNLTFLNDSDFSHVQVIFYCWYLVVLGVFLHKSCKFTRCATAISSKPKRLFLQYRRLTSDQTFKPTALAYCSTSYNTARRTPHTAVSILRNCRPTFLPCKCRKSALKSRQSDSLRKYEWISVVCYVGDQNGRDSIWVSIY